MKTGGWCVEGTQHWLWLNCYLVVEVVAQTRERHGLVCMCRRSTEGGRRQSGRALAESKRTHTVVKRSSEEKMSPLIGACTVKVKPSATAGDGTQGLLLRHSVAANLIWCAGAPRPVDPRLGEGTPLNRCRRRVWPSPRLLIEGGTARERVGEREISERVRGGRESSVGRPWREQRDRKQRSRRVCWQA